MILDLEDYLSLQRGTLSPFFEAEDEWVFVLKTASIVETVLRTAIIQSLEKESSPVGSAGAGSVCVGNGLSGLRAG
jgi:hypothetical protein